MKYRRDSYLIFGQPLIGEEEIAEVVACLRSGWIGTGPRVAKFEQAVAAYKGVKHAVAVNSCTAALHLSCLAAGLQPGDEVIVPAMTFCATVNAVVHAGATPVIADVDADTMNLDPADVARRITPRTKAILPVHFAGRACDMSALGALAKRHNLVLIEDCAHAIETTSQGQHAGTFGLCGALSFYATKNVITGEGGMILTNDDAVAARVKMLALHGMSKDAWKRFSDDGYKHYEVVEVGFKYNMMDLQAALGLHQLARVDRVWQRRLDIWNRYLAAFKDLPITLPAPLPVQGRHALHLFTILVDEKRCGVSRDRCLTELHACNIGSGVHYRAIPEHPVYQERFGWKPSDTPRATAIGEQTLSLPLTGRLTDNDVDDVIRVVRETVAAGRARK